MRDSLVVRLAWLAGAHFESGWLLVQEASPRQGAFGSTTFGTDLLVSGLSLQSQSSLEHAQGLSSLVSLQQQLQVNIMCLAIDYWAIQSAAIAVSMHLQLRAVHCLRRRMSILQLSRIG